MNLFIDNHKLPNFEAALANTDISYSVEEFFIPKTVKITLDCARTDDLAYLIMKTNCNSFKPEEDYVGF